MPGDSSKYFRPSCLSYSFLCFSLFPALSCPADERGGAYRRRVRRNGLKEERRQGLHERYVGSYFVMPSSHINTETQCRGSVGGFLTKDPFVPFIEMFLIDFEGSANDKKMKRYQTDFVIAKPAGGMRADCMYTCIPAVR